MKILVDDRKGSKLDEQLCRRLEEQNYVVFDLSSVFVNSSERKVSKSKESEDFYKLTDLSKLFYKGTKRIFDVVIVHLGIDYKLSEEEISRLVQFVLAGGGLLVLGTYGGDSIWNTNYNSLLSFFDIKLNSDVIFDKVYDVKAHETVELKDLCMEELFKNDLVPMVYKFASTKDGEELGLNKWTTGGEIFYTCSLTLGDLAKPLLVATSSYFYDKGKYKRVFEGIDNFGVIDKDRAINEVVLSACCEFGRGRVVVNGFTVPLEWYHEGYKEQELAFEFVVNILNWLGALKTQRIRLEELRKSVNGLLKNVEAFEKELQNEVKKLFEGVLEEDIEEFFVKNLELIEEGLQLVGRQHEADNAGKIDLLCKDRDGSYLVIEFKRRRAGDQVVGQLSRYMGWVKQKYNTENVRGLIIAREMDSKLAYSLIGVDGESIKTRILSPDKLKPMFIESLLGTLKALLTFVKIALS